jgi:hypothetical protein
LNFFFAAGLRSDPLHSPPLGLLTLIASRPLEVFSDTNSTSSFSPSDRKPDIWMTDWNGKNRVVNLKQGCSSLNIVLLNVQCSIKQSKYFFSNFDIAFFWNLKWSRVIDFRMWIIALT